MKEFTIFIGSPDDVKEEREIIEEVIADTNKYYEHDEKIPSLKLIKLGTDVRSMIVNQEAQTVIDKQIEGKYNVFIGVLWKKFGSPTEEYNSGTEQEFYNAYNKHLENPNSMDIMFYFCTKVPSSMKEINGKQYTAVENFKSELQKNKGLYKEYSNTDEFKEIIKSDLIKLVTEKITFEDSDETYENDGLLDLIDDYFDNFNKSKLEMELLSKDLYNSANRLNRLNTTNMKTREETRNYFNTASETLDNISNDLNEHSPIIIETFTLGINSFNSLIKFHGDLISETELTETINGIHSACSEIDKVNINIEELIKQIDNTRQMTNKFSKSKKVLIKNLKQFKNELTKIKKEMRKSESNLFEIEE